MLKKYLSYQVEEMKNNLKTLRKQNGISQTQLSKETGISFQMISDYENNRYNMSIKRLIILANYFECSIDYLIGRTPIDIYKIKWYN